MIIDLAQIIRTGAGAGEIADAIEAAVGDERLHPGDRLATVRELAAALDVSPATVAAAYRRLGDRGIATGEGRRGTVVSAQPPLRVRRAAPLVPDARNLARGNPDPALLPDLAPVLKKLSGRQVLYGEPAKLAALEDRARESFAADGIGGEIAITSGALDGIERALQAHLRPGDIVVVEDPTWPRITDLVRALQLRPEPTAVDDAGFVPADLARALRRRPRAVIVTPRGQNPTGASLTEERAEQLASLLATQPACLVIEDDYVAEVAGAPYYPIHGTTDHWVVIRSLSKVLGPDLRIALMTGDGTTIRRVEGRQLLGAGWVSHVLQETAARLLASASTRRLLARAERTYASRRQGLRDALMARGIASHGETGLGVWIPVDDEADTVQFLVGRGWVVSGGERYRFRAAPGIRVTTTTLERADAEELAAAIDESQGPESVTYSA